MADAGLPFASLPGLGNDELDGFPADHCPEEMPDLSRHFSITADVLKEEPGLYDAMRPRRTPGGVSFAKCIKTGMDNRGHPMIKTLGAVAGDADCYDTFQPFFDKLIVRCHGEAALSTPHLRSPSRFSPAVALPSSYVVSSHLRASRNVQGLPFVPAMSRSERVEVERIVVKALLKNGLVAGSYFPLAGSQTYPLKPGGMLAKEELALTEAGRLFREPDSPAVLSTGGGRHWPDGRGVFASQDGSCTAWVNEEEHLKLMADRQDGGLPAMLAEMAMVLERLQRLMGSFAQSDRLGFLSSSPGNLGTAMNASVVVKLPMLKVMKQELGQWCKSKGLVARGALDEQGLRLEGLVEVSHRQKMGIREEEMVKELMLHVSELIRAEQCMERGMSVEAALDSVVPRELTPIGAEDEDYPGVEAWAHAGNQLGEMLSDFVVQTGVEDVKVRLAQALMASSLAGSLDATGERVKDELQKEEAAARIQAIQRGRQQRAEAKAKAQAAAKAKAKASASEAEETEKRKALLRGALEAALEDGTLEQVLAEASDGLDSVPTPAQDQSKAVENLRKKLANDLMSAADDGRLEQVLSSRQAGDSLELMRRKMAQSMLAAAEDGRLERVLSSEQQKKKEQDLEQVRSAAAATMLAAFEDGRLEQVLSSRQKKEDLERLRKATAASMLAAAEDGSLERALSRSQRAAGMDQVRQSIAAGLLAAADDGRLEAALASSRSKPAAVDDIRSRMAASLLEAAQNGTLEQALENAGLGDQASHMETLRRRIANDMVAAAENGSLERALQQVTGVADSNIETLRRRIANDMLAAAETGSLERALQQVTGVADSNMETLRRRIANDMLAAAETGSLERALQQATGLADSNMESLRRRIANDMLSAAETGSLERALQEATGLAGSPSRPGTEEVRNRVANSMLAAVEDGRFEMALQEVALPTFQDSTSTALPGTTSGTSAQTATATSTLIAMANQTAKSHLSSTSLPPQGAAAVQQALLRYERRIGSLAAAVQQAQKSIQERHAEESCLEVALSEARANLRAVAKDAEVQRKRLDAEEIRNLQLQEDHRQLVDQLDLVYLKQRHAQLDMADMDVGVAYPLAQVANQ